MIILVDNKNYMIRLCEDSETIHGMDVTYPDWKSKAKLYSDLGFMVLLNGEEAEKWLDEENIYYIHVENVKKENFERFTKRLYKMIDDRKYLLDSNNSTEKLIYGVTSFLERTYNINDADLLFKITMERKTGKYFTTILFDDKTTNEAKASVLSSIERMIHEDLDKKAIYIIEEGDFYDDINLSSGNSLADVLGKLHMYIALLHRSGK